MGERRKGAVAVLIVDDHRMFAESLARLLSDEEDITILGIADNGADAIRLADQLTPGVALVDYQMPGLDGLAIAAEIKKREPRNMVVMLTGSTDDRVVLAAIEAGCSGFLTKDRAASEVADAVRLAAAGEALISPALLARLLPQLNRTHREPGCDLTTREHEILALVVTGSANKVIAAELFLSVNTVRNCVQSILTKLGAHSRLEAVAIAVRAGILEYPPGD
jgi:DNA-binding NarL/FixJ family response regulator